MTENKLQLNADKTEIMLFNFSIFKHLLAPLSICQATISFSDSVWNPGFYLDKDLSMKEHINFGPSVWNSLPLHIRNATTIDTFKSALKTFLLNLPRI